MSEPRTKAGQQMLNEPRTKAGQWALSDAYQAVEGQWTDEDWRERIVDIENEAVREALTDLRTLAHKAAEIGFTYGALGRDFEYVYKNVETLIDDAIAAQKGAS